MGFLKKIFGSHSDHELKRLYPIADKIEAMSDEYAALTDEQLRAKTNEFKQRYADGESLSIRKPGIVQPIITIPDSLTLTETLDLFKKESSDFAVVINEYGLTVGIITLKDILWPVMGNYDVWADDQLLVERADGTWLVDGSTPVDDIEREFGIESMPEEETYETVSGFIMYMLRRVPKRGDFVEYAGYRFEVTNMDGFHIDQGLMR